LIAPHGLVALSTPVTAEDVDVILAAMDETLQEIACGQA
jgi:hypothetical protein